MTSHDWIMEVLRDIGLYAEANELPRIGMAAKNAAEVCKQELEDETRMSIEAHLMFTPTAISLKRNLS